MMNRDEAMTLCREIQNGRGTYDLREEYRAKFAIGTIPEHEWDDGLFTLGVEYGILMALVRVFDLTPEDTHTSPSIGTG